MSMDLGGAKGGVKSDINVTPLCDVMLVLLIIMMIVAPLLQQGVAVTLPKAGNTVDKPETQGQTVVALSRDKTLYLNAKPITEAELATKITELLENQKEKIVLIVIFMAALPLTQKGLDINLPAESRKANTEVNEIAQIVLTYSADKKIAVNHNDVTVADLEKRLRDIFDQRKDKTMFIIGAGK